MTLKPLIIDIFGFTITGYGLMMMVAFLVGGWLMQRHLRERQLNPDYAADIVVAAVIGGIIGAKLWYLALHGGPVFSRGGLVWYGGFVGGFLAVYLQGVWKRVPTRFTMDLTAPGLALGYGLGRVGCFLVQDDYGVPTSLPWGLKFPEGLPPTTAGNLRGLGADVPAAVPDMTVLAVHPTQLYEVAAMLLVFWVLWRLRFHRHGLGWLFGLYLVLGGVERFLVEFIRAKDDRLLGMFTLAQGTSVILIVAGTILLARWREPDALAVRPEGALRPAPAA
jgi:phosphatidylglycerol:prolipoprotein diacylglycerol transferase